MSSNRQRPGFTKQGVRNLDTIPGKSRGIRLPPAPRVTSIRMVECAHPFAFERTVDVDQYAEIAWHLGHEPATWEPRT